MPGDPGQRAALVPSAGEFMTDSSILRPLKHAAAWLLLCGSAPAAFPTEPDVATVLEEAELIYQTGAGPETAYEYLSGAGAAAAATEVMVRRARYASEAGMVAEAEELYWELLNRDPQDGMLYNALGFLLAEFEYARLQEALALLDRALELTPNQPEIYSSYGFALAQLGYLDEAEEYYAQAVQLLDGRYSKEILLDYGVLLLETGQDERAISIFGRMAELDPDSPESTLYPQLMWMLHKRQVLPETLELLASIEQELGTARRLPPEIQLTLFYAYALYLYGDEAAARLQLSHIAVDETLPRRNLELYAKVREEMGDVAEAERVYRFLLNLDPDNPHYRSDLVFLLAEAGRKLPEAAAIAERGLELTPDWPELLASYAWVLHRQGRPTAAIAVIERSLNREYGMKQYELVRTFAHYGVLLWERGFQDYAIDFWRQALSIDREHDILLESLQSYDIAPEALGF